MAVDLEKGWAAVERVRFNAPVSIADVWFTRMTAGSHASASDTWFAWHPVRLGALGTGRLAWMRRLWRNRCLGVTIYQDLAN
jgi:hypothetical protein